MRKQNYLITRKERERILEECRAFISEVEPPQNWRTRIYRILDIANQLKASRGEQGDGDRLGVLAVKAVKKDRKLTADEKKPKITGGTVCATCWIRGQGHEIGMCHCGRGDFIDKGLLDYIILISKQRGYEQGRADKNKQMVLHDNFMQLQIAKAKEQGKLDQYNQTIALLYNLRTNRFIYNDEMKLAIDMIKDEITRRLKSQLSKNADEEANIEAYKQAENDEASRGSEEK